MIQTRRKLSGWALGLLLALIFLLVHLLRNILVPFALAAGGAYVLTPLVDFLHKRTAVSRITAAVLTYLAVAGAVLGGAWKVGTNVYTEAMQFSTDVSANTHLLIARLLGGEQSDLFGIHLDAREISEQVAGLVQIGFAQPQIMKMGGLAVGAAFTAVLFLVLLFYFLVRGRELAVGVLRLAPPEYRPAIGAFAAQAHPIMLRYVRGLLVIVLFTAVVVSIGLGTLFRVGHPLLLGVALGILELLPVLGPTVAAFLLFGSVAMHGGTIWNLLGLGAFWFALRQTIDQVVGPIVLGRAVRLPPVAVIFAFLAGGVLFGILGLLVAIPAAALFKLLLDNYYALPIE
ncbi:MAG TPA: AI-2E family transporter [Verrucomicrobiae bacterium]|nr:AI-2E family transporter [Verrucomicrobiae bacterium]